MGIWESALILLGIGIVSQRFKAGVGLGELGVGIRELAGAPLGGIGTGLGEFSGGLRSFAESLGDIGRGFGELFKNIPGYGAGEGFGGNGAGARNGNGTLFGNGVVPPGYPGNGLLTVSGGDDTAILTGGGGNVPRGFNGGGIITTPPLPILQPPQNTVVNIGYTGGSSGAGGARKGILFV